MSLDDLLSYDDEAPPRRPRGERRALRIWAAVVVVPAVAWALWLMLRPLGMRAPYPLVLGLVATLTILRALLRGLDIGALPATLRDLPQPTRPADEAPADDGIGVAVRGWEARLDWTRRDPRRFDAIVRPAIADIVDERLRLGHGISLRSDPDRARAVVPPELWRFIHEPSRRSLTPQRLAALVDQMEAV